MLIPTKVLRDENSVDNKVKPEDQMSAAAIIKSRCSIITGILRSLVLYLYQNNIDSDKVTDKINAVVNAFASTKDIPPYDLTWIRNTYLPSLSSMRCAVDSECPYVAISSKPYLYWYTIIGNILDDYSIFNYIYDTDSDTAPKFNDNEKTKEFVITIPRKEHHINAPTSEIRHQPQGKNAPSSGKTHQPQGENAPSSGETHQPQGENAPTKLKVHKVSQKVQDILNFCSIPRTAQEIMNRLGIQNQSRSRKRYIQALIDAGLLERTIPENPNDPNQKYRRVRK